MKLSDITLIQVLGAILVINGALAGGVNELTDLLGPVMAKHVLSICVIGSGICGGFITMFGGLGTQARNVVAGGASIAVGPNASPSLATLAMDPAQNKIDAAPGAGAAVAAIAKNAAAILVAFLVSCALLLPGSAHAQLKTPAQIQSAIDDGVAKAVAKLKNANQAVAVAGSAGQSADQLEKVMSAIAEPFKNLADFIASDPTGAAALATQVPGLQDTNGKACWTKMQDAGAVFQAHPVPVTLKVMTDFEALRLLQMTANNLCSYTPCTVVFSDGANLAVAAASAVGGALTSNSVPSLTQLCARIPQMSPQMSAAVITALAGPTPTPAPAPASNATPSVIAPAATPSPTPSPSPSPVTPIPTPTPTGN